MSSNMTRATVRNLAVFGFAAAFLILDVNGARAEILLSTVNMTVVDEFNGGSEYPDTLVVSFDVVNVPTDQRRMEFDVDTSSVGVTRRIEVGTDLFPRLNEVWQNGRRNPNTLRMDLVGLRSGFSLSDERLFGGGSFMSANGEGTYTVDSEVTPNSVDLFGLDRQVTHFDLTLNDFANMIVEGGPEPQFTTTADITFHVFGRVGPAVPEPNSFLLGLIAAVVMFAIRYDAHVNHCR